MKKVRKRKLSDWTTLTPQPDSCGENQMSVKSVANADPGRMHAANTTARNKRWMQVNMTSDRMGTHGVYKRSRQTLHPTESAHRSTRRSERSISTHLLNCAGFADRRGAHYRRTDHD